MAMKNIIGHKIKFYVCFYSISRLWLWNTLHTIITMPIHSVLVKFLFRIFQFYFYWTSLVGTFLDFYFSAILYISRKFYAVVNANLITRKNVWSSFPLFMVLHLVMDFCLRHFNIFINKKCLVLIFLTKHIFQCYHSNFRTSN